MFSEYANEVVAAQEDAGKKAARIFRGWVVFNRRISMQEWADLHEEMEVSDRQIAGPALVTTGAHPALGAVVAIQCEDGMHILTELLMVLSEMKAKGVLPSRPLA